MKIFTMLAGTLLIAGCGVSGDSTSSYGVVVETLPVTPTSVSTVEIAPVVLNAEVEALLADLGQPAIEGLGGVDCAREMAHIAIAGQRYQERVGADAATLADLTLDLDVDLVLWTLDEELGQLVPGPGSPCNDFVGAQEQESAAQTCMINQKTLETAVEATYAQTGALPLDQQQLVDDGMIRELTDGFQVVDGMVLLVAGSECEELLEERDAQLDAETAAAIIDPADCDVRRRTLEVAVEAFYAEFGEVPATEAALVETEMLRAEFADFDLTADATVVAAPDSVCS